MVAGIAKYRNTDEAFPLDKKILNKIAMRSFLAAASENAESGNSTGWTWAIAPGLAKIHENEDDLALAMGHHLEFVSCISPLSTLAMGIVLALEQQKADPQTIRGVRTAASLAAEGVGNALIRWILIPMLLVCFGTMIESGAVTGVVLFAAVLLVCTVALRFWALRYGYSRGTRAAESLIRNRDSLERAARIAGVCMIGAAIVLLGSNSDFNVWLQGVNVSYIGTAIPGLCCALVTWLAYVLMAKKNWPVWRCVLLVIIIGILMAVLGGVTM